MKKTLVSVAVVGFLMSGCAKKADAIKATYVSPIGYSKLSCSQLLGEVSRVNKRLSKITQEQAGVSNKDVAALGVGVLIFPPALLLMAMGDDQKAEISNLKGQYNTIRDVGATKNCSFVAGMK